MVPGEGQCPVLVCVPRNEWFSSVRTNTRFNHERDDVFHPRLRPMDSPGRRRLGRDWHTRSVQSGCCQNCGSMSRNPRRSRSDRRRNPELLSAMRREEYAIYGPELDEDNGNSWGRATFAFFSIINDQLAGSSIASAINGERSRGYVLDTGPAAGRNEADEADRLAVPACGRVPVVRPVSLIRIDGKRRTRRCTTRSS